jgi:hypothetical protein
MSDCYALSQVRPLIWVVRQGLVWVLWELSGVLNPEAGVCGGPCAGLSGAIAARVHQSIDLIEINVLVVG